MPLDWLPNAIRRPTHEDGFAWQANCPPKIVWHTTEGFGVPNYPSQYEPHLTVVANAGKGVTVYQHIALTKAAYALKHTGSAPTNGAHALQIELAGTCDPHGPSGAYYWPRADDAVLRDLWAQVGKPLTDAYAIPLAAPPFKAYPASAGANGVRFTDAQWLAWSGHCGHQHIPGNDHGDPGAFPWDRLAQFNQEDDMPTAQEIAAAVWGYPVGEDVEPDGKTHTTQAIASQRNYHRLAGLPTALATQLAGPLSAALIPQITAALKNTGGTLTDADVARIATASATELATRLVR